MRPQVVALGIDSLNVGFNIGKWLVDESAFKRLEEGKASAGGRLFGGKGVTVEWGGSEFNILPKGGDGYEYIMFNEDVRLNVAKNCEGGRVYPEVFAQFNSAYLWGLGYQSAYEKFLKWLRVWAEVVGEKVNRVDLCVDLAVDLPRLDVAKEVVTRARKKVNYFQVEHYTSGRRDTGYRFGGTPVMARIYDKGYELHKSDKVWFRPIWLSGGWDGESNITRVEFQTRRPFLKDYQVNTYAEMTFVLPDVWRGLTNKYLVLKEPNGQDSNHRRWPTSPLWEVVQGAGSHFGECLGIERWKQKQAKIDPLIAQMKGLIASEVALDSTIRGEHFAIPRLKSLINTYMESEEFFAKVLEKRGRYGNLSG